MMMICFRLATKPRSTGPRLSAQLQVNDTVVNGIVVSVLGTVGRAIALPG